MKNHRLRLSELFCSLQGESYLAGYRTGFIRLIGCNLRCAYCDTTFAYEGGKETSVHSIIDKVRKMQVSRLCVTGGEPLLQKNTPFLLRSLCDEGYTVSLETNGSFPIKGIPKEVIVIADYKTEGSKEAGSFLKENIPLLRAKDELKFVCSSEEDVEESVQFIRNYFPDKGADRSRYPTLTLSASFGQIEPAFLAELLLKSKLSHVRLQLQLHKLLWGNKRGV